MVEVARTEQLCVRRDRNRDIDDALVHVKRDPQLGERARVGRGVSRGPHPQSGRIRYARLGGDVTVGQRTAIHVQALLELEPHVDRRLGLELQRRIGQEGGDLDLVGAQLDGRRLVTSQNLAQGGVADGAGRLPGTVVPVEELLGDHAVLVGHVDAGERHAVKAATCRLLGVVG